MVGTSHVTNDYKNNNENCQRIHEIQEQKKNGETWNQQAQEQKDEIEKELSVQGADFCCIYLNWANH